jgi:hypothetical protein
MKHMLIGAGFGALLAISGQAAAQGMARNAAPVVIELFTSQGCSSCPPADEMLRSFAAREDVMALSLHVDYWDYLGWVDIFAQPSFTQRQKAYAYVSGARAIYTPQLIVAGSDTLVGADPVALAALVKRHLDSPHPVALTITRQGSQFQIDAVAEPPLSRPVVLQLVRYRPLVSVTITRGENAGRTAEYANVASDWMTLGEWDGASPLRLMTTVDGPEPAVVIVQELRANGKYAALPGPILAAARLD